MAMGLHTFGSGSRRGRGARAPMAEINVTPLVDVMLVLLIIFMVTAPLLKAGVPVELYVWPEMPHVFPLFHFLPEARQALELIARFVLRHTPADRPKTDNPRKKP